MPVHHHEEGQKLLDVAGRSTLPRPEQESSRHYVLNSSEKKMIGRYLVTISCQDPIARCAAGQQGSVEYIINLMADGSVFRLIKSFGKVYADTRNMQGYNNNHWEVVVENQKQYVLISFGQGFRFYFEIDAKGNLIMDSQRNFKINRQFFKQGHPYTLTRYYLVRAAN